MNIDKIVILSLKHFTLSLIIEVAIPVPLRNTFDYLCNQKVSIGARVKVPFGQKKVTAIVLSHKKKSDFDKLRSVEEILDQEALLSKEILDFLFWSANYYHHPVGEVLASALPKNLRQGKSAVIKKISAHKNTTSPSTFEVTTEQDKAIKSVLKSENNFHGYLLHGVTGSEKLKCT